MSSEIVLVACYELGHQPLSLAAPLAVLSQANLSAEAYDLSVETLPDAAILEAKLVAIAVPMHTSLRLGVAVAKRVREVNPAAHISFFGLYAWLNASYLLGDLADSVIGGEYETPLLNLASALINDKPLEDIQGITTINNPGAPYLEKLPLPIPYRATLPPLSKYSGYLNHDRQHIAGYTEASRGCLHMCKHCPIVPVYNGRFFVIPFETVMADIRQQVKMGAEHITFGDPDFLNGPGHSLKIGRALHAEFPDITFDFTCKVEHILEYRHLIPDFAETGCTFIVSAFESTQDDILEKLVKGHTIAQMDEALTILSDNGISANPTWMPFTPWTTLEGYLELLGWIRERNLIPNVPVVQLSIRMLIPPGSAVIDPKTPQPWLGELDQENFSYCWEHPDPRVDELQRQVSAIAAQYAEQSPYAGFAQVEAAAYALAGKPQPLTTIPALEGLPAPPQLTEHWFC